jgi:hypothetical protein
MERKEIIELAKKNGMVEFVPIGSNALWEQIEKFVTIAVEEEREACAKVCEDKDAVWKKAGLWRVNHEYKECADAIRARALADRGEA